jgi:alkanesulfonate monooxygenase SsuD/methylene tetrahydromethanopterin reductase-like flavin-dependent oxidoreductase (luciferase family)
MEKALKKRAASRNASVEKVREQVASALWGTPDEIASKLEEYKELGVEYAILMFPHEKEIEQIQMMKNVI